MKHLGSIEEAFAACDATCFSGCFHGAIERMLHNSDALPDETDHLDPELIASVVKNLCKPEKLKDTSNFFIRECIHGTGHAVLYTLDYDLNQALQLCDLFDENDRSTCYSGVFMENITASDRSKRHLKSNNILYPCTAVADAYKSACYYFQPSVMMERGLTSDQISAICNDMRYADDCFDGYGRELDMSVRQGDPDYARHVCEDLAGSHWQRCIVGLLKTAIGTNKNGESAYTYCSAIHSQEYKSFCLQSVGSLFNWSFGWDTARVLEDCHTFAGQGSALCADVVRGVGQ